MQLLRIATVVEITGRARTSIYEDVKKGHFPRPVRLSRRCVGWHRNEVEAWVASRPRTGAAS